MTTKAKHTPGPTCQHGRLFSEGCEYGCNTRRHEERLRTAAPDMWELVEQLIPLLEEHVQYDDELSLEQVLLDKARAIKRQVEG